MKIIALSDIHGEKTILTALQNEIKSADLTLLVGDITDFGRDAKMREMIGLARPFTKNLLAVIGNCDFPETLATIEELGCSIENRVPRIGEFDIMGLGASLPTPSGKTPNEVNDSVLSDRLDAMKSSIRPSAPLIFVSHQSPYETKTDMIQTGAHVGSKAVRNFIETHQPMVCFTGHIHESAGIDLIGKTQVVNPGPAFAGKYVTAEIDGDLKSLEIKSL